MNTAVTTSIGVLILLLVIVCCVLGIKRCRKAVRRDLTRVVKEGNDHAQVQMEKGQGGIIQMLPRIQAPQIMMEPQGKSMWEGIPQGSRRDQEGPGGTRRFEGISSGLAEKAF